jgi:hypothetical protein
VVLHVGQISGTGLVTHDVARLQVTLNDQEGGSVAGFRIIGFARDLAFGIDGSFAWPLRLLGTAWLIRRTEGHSA